MRKCIVLIILLSLVITGSQAQETSLCDDNPALYISFGSYCLNPVTFNISEMQYPIGSVLLFWDGMATDIGIVSGYSWQLAERIYAYWLIVSPADWQRIPMWAGEYKIAFPENIYGVQQ